MEQLLGGSTVELAKMWADTKDEMTGGISRKSGGEIPEMATGLKTVMFDVAEVADEEGGALKGLKSVEGFLELLGNRRGNCCGSSVGHCGGWRERGREGGNMGMWAVEM